MLAFLTLAATILFEGPPLPDGRREVLIELDAPWSFFCEWDEDEPAHVSRGLVLIDNEPEGGE